MTKDYSNFIFSEFKILAKTYKIYFKNNLSHRFFVRIVLPCQITWKHFFWGWAIYKMLVNSISRLMLRKKTNSCICGVSFNCWHSPGLLKVVIYFRFYLRVFFQVYIKVKIVESSLELTFFEKEKRLGFHFDFWVMFLSFQARHNILIEEVSSRFFLHRILKILLEFKLPYKCLHTSFHSTLFSQCLSSATIYWQHCLSLWKKM